MSASTSSKTRSAWITAGLVIALIAVIALSFALAPKEDEFPGADAQATEQVTEGNPDYEPWFDNIFTPGSGEIESGLFALQAAIGAAVLGYVFGALRTRRKYERLLEQAGAAAGPAAKPADDDVEEHAERGSDAAR